MKENPVEKAGAPASHVGIVAVVGRTNAGKSTLVNRLLGEKISIVSPVVQTTRTVIRGVLTEDRGQVVFLDTPGLHKSRSKLGTEMNKRARSSLAGADVVLLMCDGSRDPLLEDEGWMQRLVRSEAPVIVFLNKADLACKGKKFRQAWEEAVASSVRQEEQAEVRARLEQKCSEGESPEEQRPSWKKRIKGYAPPRPLVKPIWMIGSASSGEGVPELLDRIFALLPEGGLLFDADTLTDYPRKLAVADLIRERFFLKFRDELPHAIGVKVDSITPHPDGMTSVKATVFVQRHNQKGIVLGEKGRTLRSITRESERVLTDFFDGPVKIELWIKVEPNWDENYFLLRQAGYL